jgi:hypothetical protein
MHTGELKFHSNSVLKGFSPPTPVPDVLEAAQMLQKIRDEGWFQSHRSVKNVEFFQAVAVSQAICRIVEMQFWCHNHTPCRID